MQRLGVMGGTFDPLHWAHLVVAEEARERFELDRVLFIPAGTPPHKSEQPVSDAEHRYAMTLLGVSPNPAFEVSRMELEREGPSYSVDTIRRLREIHGPGVEIYFLVGADEALDIPKWHEAESLPGMVSFLAAPRPGLDIGRLDALPERFRRIIELLPAAPMDISATGIREKVRAGRSITYLVPESVETYIRKHKLYVRSPEEEGK